MKDDNRQSRRRPVHYTAWIALKPEGLQNCFLSDVSDTGARISVQNSEKIPDHFMLWLANNGSTRRACSVVWRKPNQIGVRFNGKFVQGEKASLPPRRTTS